MKHMRRLASANSAEPEVLYGVNIVVLRGELTSDPVVRELPSGDEVTNLEITTPLHEGRPSIPVVVEGSNLEVSVGDQVVVVGRVRRRFFRAGVGVQSRTEVLATTVMKARQSARIRRAIEPLIEELAEFTV